MFQALHHRSHCFLALAAIFLTHCENKPKTRESAASTVSGTIQKNQLANLPSAILNHAADSPVHWQPCTPASLDDAKQSERPLFLVLVSANTPGSYEVLRTIDENRDIVNTLNEHYVPVLADFEIHHELALLAARYAQMQNQAISFPFFFVVSPDGAPITTQSLIYQNDEQVAQFLSGNTNTISRMWSESRSYMLKDSRKKLTRQQERPYESPAVIKEDSARVALYRETIRRLMSFYNEENRSFHGSGGVLPTGIIDILSLASTHRELPEPLRKQSRESLIGLIDTLKSSAMIDPLDGGIFKNRKLNTWDLPTSLRTTEAQAVAIRSFATVAQYGLHDDALSIALGATRFAEENFLLENGLFSAGVSPQATNVKDLMWTTGQIYEALSEKEAKLWIEIANIKNLGNMPYDADPRRYYYRYNSLTIKTPIKEAAEKVGIDPQQALTIYESGRQKLLAARRARLPDVGPDPHPSASASFLMISAYAHLFTATDNDEWKDKALALGKRCREAFGSSRHLKERLNASHPALGDARSYTYTLAARAAVDLADISLDRQWILWAQDLVSQIGEDFIQSNGMLATAREEQRIIPLSIEDATMIYSDSTAGLLIQVLGRLRAQQLDVPPSLRDWVHRLPDIKQRPIVFSDFIRALATDLNQNSPEE